MSGVPTLLRLAEHEALSRVTLQGSVLDLGGDTHAEYRSQLGGTFSVTTVNLDEHTAPDIFHDLETPLPTPDASYDHVLLINVLEHIYHARELLAEAVRSIRPGGTVVVIVPFLFPVHPDPHDYWRFSGETLERMFSDLGLTDLMVTPLGSGVFAARYVMLDRLLPHTLRVLASMTLRHLVGPLDRLFVRLARTLGKKYRSSDYALGYLATGKKRS